MRSENNREKWLSLISTEAREKCGELLKLTHKMRESTVIFPAENNVLRALEEVSPDEVKVVIIGQDPYHDEGQAMGLAFSVPEGVKLPPSLRNIYKEIEADTGAKPPQSGDLTRWAEQGVLLLNTVLTVEAHKADSHKKLGWQQVTTEIIEVCAKLSRPVVFMCWGRPAIELAEKALKKSESGNKYMICSTHPSPLSANNKKTSLTAFIGSRQFGKANLILFENNIKPVMW